MLWSRKRRAEPEFYSDLRQDRWVASVFNDGRKGYFLDFGAFDGLDMSNTLHLERTLGWTGICVEPNPTYYPKLCAERSAICVNLALWSRSREVLTMVDAHGLSAFEHLKDGDSNAATRNLATQRRIEVETVNPTALLERFAAPATIEYMSLDVEGSELEILAALDLERYDIRLMSIEHDCQAERQAQVREHLAAYGYVGMQMGYDDFFYRESGTYPVSPREAAIRLGFAG